MFKIIGIVGSLRKDSLNKKLLVAAARLCPAGAKIELLDFSKFPIYNQDSETVFPEAVIDAKKNIRAADAVLFATPEYNYSVPGPLKNMIDWCSRPYGKSAWQGKPVAVMSASPGALGGSRAQYHLRQSFVFLDMHPVQSPEVIVSHAEDKFDANGELIDETTKDKVAALLQALVDLTKRLAD